ncbi:TIGR00266 family protein [Gehongia tenuis]|uniref:TIGR00266 family protein n=1 Tax=Gehongia tenuis TaxID=2763655 RepID=A0A926HQY1_9FIRM|nr:TIGR00266 family protein [Gehongia tenuis]MBC8531711.1 TIGR00266 family protein [Gehongia tenuis]
MRYEISGESLPAVTCWLNSGESMITERGSMSWMSPNMVMETTTSGGLGRALGRMFAGEALFQNRYTANGDGMITFASSFPGSIMPFEITPGEGLIVQKSGFLASEAGVELSIHFQRKLGSGFFGGEGFILQRLSGNGTAFVEIDGSLMEYDLQSGQTIVVSSGHLAAMSESCSMDVQTVKGAKNIIFGGEGLFNTVITGPGRVILQTMPISSVAGALAPFFHNNNG